MATVKPASASATAASFLSPHSPLSVKKGQQVRFPKPEKRNSRREAFVPLSVLLSFSNRPTPFDDDESKYISLFESLLSVF